MKTTQTSKMVTGFLALAFMAAVTGCVKDPYGPGNNGNKLPEKGDYFDFNLTQSVQLSINYGVPGMTAVVEVYDQNPLQDGSVIKKEGISPIFKVYVNDGQYDGKINIPTAVSQAYLYTDFIAAPQCVKLEASVAGFDYDITKENVDASDVFSRSSTGRPVPQYAMGLVDKTKFPYEVATTANAGGKRNDNLYSITAWQPSGFECINLNYYKNPQTIGAAEEKIGDVTTRMIDFMEAQRKIDGNKSLLRNPEDINLKVPATATEGMEVNVTYVGERASFFNTFGYYYYQDKGQALTPEEFLKIRKYVMIPNVDAACMKAGETVKLLYFDENGVQSDKFPANYVIGWFVIANGFGNNPPGAGVGGYANGGVIKSIPADAYTSSKYSAERYTCMSDDKGADRRFVSLYDTKSKLRVIGIEDGVRTNQTPDDYMDIMFVVQTSIDLGGGELPPIDPVDPDPKPETLPLSGTLAYEDIWPHGGDYDLNDVIIEYKREITFGSDNIVSKIVETFKPVQKNGSAAHDNFFACQYTKSGKVTLPAGMILESSTNSVLIEASARSIAGNIYVVERDMTGLGLNQESVIKDFNPYIIARQYTADNRVEVHLPKHEMTSAADKSLMNKDNAYYIASDGIYPFAIAIPIAGFVPADETKKIDSPGQYTSFTKWATSKGTENKDWYLHKDK